MAIDSLNQLFLAELQGAFYSENTVCKFLPAMEDVAASAGLKSAINTHIQKTRTHIQSLIRISSMLGQPVKARRSDAIDGIIREATDQLTELEGGEIRDAAIILMLQKISNYETATYGALRKYASRLGYIQCSERLQDTLADKKRFELELNCFAEVRGSIRHFSIPDEPFYANTTA